MHAKGVSGLPHLVCHLRVSVWIPYPLLCTLYGAMYREGMRRPILMSPVPDSMCLKGVQNRSFRDLPDLGFWGFGGIDPFGVLKCSILVDSRESLD